MDQQQASAEAKTKTKASERPRQTQKTGPGNCPQCGHANPGEATFCGECGAPLGGTACPQCTHPVHPKADRCEHCGAWLHAEQCRYCSLPIPEGAPFCPDCGLPQNGLLCPTCGTTNPFDFCSKCGQALSPQARQLAAQSATDPELRKTFEALREPAVLEGELERLASEIARAETEASPPGPSGEPPAPEPRRRGMSEGLRRELQGLSSTQAAEEQKLRDRQDQKKRDEETIQEAQRQKKLAELKRLKAEAEARKVAAQEAARKALEKMREMVFETAQEARRFHMANRPQGPAGWLCNWANFFHTDGPNGCGNPALGGYWCDGNTVPKD